MAKVMARFAHFCRFDACSCIVFNFSTRMFFPPALCYNEQKGGERMNTLQDYAYKLGCGRLIFEHQALEKLGAEIRLIGGSAYVIGGEQADRAVGDSIRRQLCDAGVRFEAEVYPGACTLEKARVIAERCRAQQYAVIIGFGGGRILDLVKLAGDAAGLPVATIPTIAATCAAYTPLSVAYTAEGCCGDTWYFQQEVRLVLCDLDVLCRQPPRYLAAGLLDAMAKQVEIGHYLDRLPGDRQDVLLAQMMARSCFEDLTALGPQAVEQLRRGAPGPELERCIFHAIVTTGLISGTARGAYQAALAHALYYAVRTLYPVQSRGWLHGEIVAVGLLLQAAFLGQEELAAQLRAFMRALRMPLTLAEIGLPEDDGALAALAAHPSLQVLYTDPQPDEARVRRLLRSELTQWKG